MAISERKKCAELNCVRRDPKGGVISGWESFVSGHGPWSVRQADGRSENGESGQTINRGDDKTRTKWAEPKRVG